LEAEKRVAIDKMKREMKKREKVEVAAAKVKAE
jgi:hypothetical protein